jgi:hypothetical protein
MRVSLGKELIYCRARYALHTDVSRLSIAVLAFGASSNSFIMRFASAPACDSSGLTELLSDVFQDFDQLNIANIKATPARASKLIS